MNDFYLHSFLNEFNDYIEDSLFESLQLGYKCIFEGYADVVSCTREDAVSQFNYSAAYNNAFGINPIMAFLHNSSDNINKMYSVDEEPELDYVSTRNGELIQHTVNEKQSLTNESSDFDEPDMSYGDEIHEKLNLTSAELNNLL